MSADPSVLESVSRLSVRCRVLERLLSILENDLTGDRLWEEALDAALEAVPCEAGSVFVAGPKGALTIRAARGRVASQVRGLKLKAGQGLAGACAAQGGTIAVSDVRSDPRHATAISGKLGFETRSLLAVPVPGPRRPVAVIELINKTLGDLFGRHEVELVERVARAAGAAAKGRRR